MDIEAQIIEIKNDLEDQGYEIDHFEIREEADYGPEAISKQNYQRAVGETYQKALAEWNEISSNTDEFVIEVFPKSSNPLERFIYDSRDDSITHIDYPETDTSKTGRISDLLEE